MSEIVSEFPIMQGHARMALGSGDFEVPLFSNIDRGLWTGCSPAEFPDELEEFGYNPLKARSAFLHIAYPTVCHWLYQEWTREMVPSGAGGVTKMVLGRLEGTPRFDAILNLYPWGKYVVPDGIEYREAALYDSEHLSEEIDDLAMWVLDQQPDLGRNVLIHCQAGLNRSNLVAARVLMIGKGLSADEAIDLIRAKRSPTCLCNRHFEAWLRAFDGE